MPRSSPVRLPLALAALVSAGTAAAQPAQPPVTDGRQAVYGATLGQTAALGADRVYAATAVDKAVMAQGRNRAPEYPAALRAEGIAGEVLVVAVVNTAGRIEMDSLTIARATDARFVPAVRAALEGWRFHPAELRGRKVSQRVELPFVFTSGRAPAALQVSAVVGTAPFPNDMVYSVPEVDLVVATRGGNPAPAYPPALRAARMEGEVLISGVVDAAGRLEPGSLQVVRATHELFAAAVLAVLPRWRFAPAEVGGRKVRQRVDIPFVFR